MSATQGQGIVSREEAEGRQTNDAGDLLALLERRDQRLAELSAELAERTRRVAVLEAGFEALALPVEATPVVGELQVFWTVGGKVSEAASARRPVREDGTLTEWLIPVPAESEGPLRVDLGNRPGFWEVVELAVFGVDGEGAMEASPRSVCGASGGYAGLELRTGLLRLAGGGEGDPLRVYAYTGDPQMHWAGAGATGKSVLRVRLRGMGMLRGLMSVETELFQKLLRTALSESGAREKQWHEGLVRVSGELGALREKHQQLAAELKAAREGTETLRQELGRRQAEREAVAAELAESLRAGGQLARQLEARDEAARRFEAELAAARKQLEQAARTSAELAELRSRTPAPPPTAVKTPTQPALADELLREREALASERERLASERGVLLSERDRLARELAATKEAEAARRQAEADSARAREIAAQEEARRQFGNRVRRKVKRLLGKREPTESEQAAETVDGYAEAGVRALFDEGFYREQVPGLPAESDALRHYLTVGWLEGHDPHPLFATRWYRERWSDVGAAGVCPLVHYARHGGMEGRSPHPLFDTPYYLHQNLPAEAAKVQGVTPLAHYLAHGDRSPHPLFDHDYYAHTYGDVAKSGVRLLVHFARYGARELRNPHPLFDSAYYLEHNPDVRASGMNPLAHYVARGSNERRNPHPLFDNAYYLTQCPAVERAGMAALDHYLRWGWKQGRQPHPAFDVAYYLRENPDVARKGVEPLTHFVQFGWREHRDPSAAFDVRYYLLVNPEVGSAGINPLVHYLRVRRTQSPEDRLDAAKGLGRLVVLREGLSGAESGAIESAGPAVVVCEPGRYVPQPGDYVHAPQGKGLTANELRNVALCLAHQGYDFVVVSRGMKSDAVLAEHVADAVVWSAEAWLRRQSGRRLPAGTTGRLARLMGVAAKTHELREWSLAELGLGTLVELEGELVVAGPGVARPGRVVRHRVTGYPVSLKRSGRPLVWAMPLLLAVGGVERNMVEVMKAVGGDAGDFDFLVVTTERVRAEHGSLHHQAEAAGLGVIDLGEIAPAELHLELISTLRRCTGPSAVWICNGSPWLAENAGALKAVLGDCAVVDQQVYDAEAGWIAHFGSSAGLRGFDRYVAINSHIRRAFTEKYAIDPGRVDLIYHMIDDERFFRRDLGEAGVAELRRKWGLPETGEVFAQVGRLTDQKQPLRFLEMVKSARDAGDAAHFALVGNGELSAACDAYIAEHALTNVTRIPFVEDMSALLPGLTGLVMSSKFEGLPIVILEALACGVPVLSTDVGDVRMLLEGYGSGRLVGEGGKDESMYAAWTTFRVGLERYRRAAAERAEEVRRRFSRKAIGEAYTRSFTAAIAQVRGLRADVRVKPTTELSVVMPTYNRAETLERTLRSCLRYSAGLPVEYVIVDDGSRDATPGVLEKLAASTGGRMTVRRVSNGGPGQARNLAAQLAKGDVLLIMGDDAEPAGPAFFTTHLDLHRRNPARGYAVLGKMVWPDDPETDVTFVMKHIQGHGGEQFGYADLTPYTELDWRFFYTANLSVKRNLVDDWSAEGFARAFRFAAWEDAELAYRMSRRTGPDKLKLIYAPTSLGYHHHRYTVDQFISRQMTAGMMLRVMLELHPELTEVLLPAEVTAALAEPVRPDDQKAAADLLAVIEGVKAWARLIETRRKLGSVAWHQQLLFGVFEAAYLQGYLMSERRVEANVAKALERVIDRCVTRAQASLQNELLGYGMRSNKLVPTA